MTNSWSLANATRLPQKVTPPMMPDATIAVVICRSVTGPALLASISAAPATRTDAPPPNPLSRPTICGIAVIAILNAMTAPATDPTANPARMTL